MAATSSHPQQMMAVSKLLTVNNRVPLQPGVKLLFPEAHENKKTMKSKIVMLDVAPV